MLKVIHHTCMCAQSCLTLFNLMDCSLPDSSVHGILQAKILVWDAIPFSRGILPIQGLNPESKMQYLGAISKTTE